MSKRNIIYLEATKEKATLHLSLKAAPEIEQFFADLAKEQFGTSATQTSEKWFDEGGVGLKFYKTTPKIDEYMRSLPNTINNFGNGLTHNGSTNLALLRVVGISSGIKINTSDLVAYDELTAYIRDLAEQTKKLYENYIKKMKVKATIAFEV